MSLPLFKLNKVTRSLCLSVHSECYLLCGQCSLFSNIIIFCFLDAVTHQLTGHDTHHIYFISNCRSKVCFINMNVS